MKKLEEKTFNNRKSIHYKQVKIMKFNISDNKLYYKKYT